MQTYVMDPLGASYLERTAVHLDLVQWATDPVWSDITDTSVQRELVDSDIPFLRSLIDHADYDLILLNGRTVVETFLGFGLLRDYREERRVLGDRFNTTLFEGTVLERRALGWSLNVPGRSLPADRRGLAEWLMKSGQR